MPQFFLNKRLIFLLVSIIILVALIGFTIRDREKITLPEQFIKDAIGWVQNVTAKPQQYIVNLVNSVKDIQNTYSENKELKARLDELAVLEATVYQLEKENKELREILDKQETLRDFTPIQGTVIGRNPEQWHEHIIINKGEVHGVKKNMAVITSKGLIGKVKTTQKFTSTVQLLSAMDPTNRISALIQGEEMYFGTIEGYDEERELLLLKRIPYDAKVEKGENVITSGLGGIFPEGLPIGKVVDVEPDEFGLNLTAYVKPGANFYNIQNVMVVKREMINPDLSDIHEEGDES